MDTHLPLSVPFLLPDGDIPRAVVEALQSPELGVLHPDRRWVFVPMSRKLLHVHRLYYYGSTAPLNQPLATWFGFNYLASVLRQAFEKRAGNRLPANTVVILERQVGSRSFSAQQPQLLDAIKTRLEKAGHADVGVVTLAPTPDNLLQVGEALLDAAVVVGSHGAALNNLFMVRAGAAVLELGYTLDWWPWPTEFICLARNLGIHYYPLFGETDASEPMTIDVEHVAATVVMAWLDVAPGLMAKAGAA